MFSPYFLGIATVFMLHRVYPSEINKLLPNENMKVSPEFLEKFIIEAKLKGYSFISLSRLYGSLLNNENLSKAIVITLDDGYADNYTHAYPIFKKHDIPFIIYVTTSFPDNTAILWWYILEDIIIQNESIKLNNELYFKCSTQEQKIETFMSLREKIIALPKENFFESIQAMFKRNTIDWHAKTRELAMTWNQIEKISNDSLATIGAHTINHFALAGLSKNELINEVVGSRDIIETHIDNSVEHFCYPFGERAEATKKEFEIINKLQFKTATTTRFGNIFPAHKNHLSALPRVMLTNDFLWSKFEYSLMKQFLKGRVVVD